MTAEVLAAIAELIREESGIQLRSDRYPALRAAIARAEPNAAPVAFLELARDPGSGPAALARLIDEVTVHESSFFREWDALEALSWRLMLSQAQARGSSVIRVWSAACSTGEEVYSLAIAACEAFAPGDPPVRILGTDIANAALDRARDGRYRERPLRAVPPALRSRYFAPDGREQLVGERPRRLVEFRQHNLARDPAPPADEEPFDLVLCRNVLIYLDAETVDRVVRALERSVYPDGSLILGTADVLCETTQRLTRFAEQSDSPGARDPRPAALRRPLGLEPERNRTLAEAVRAAGDGRHEEALADTAVLLALDPLDADASFVRGLVLLESGAFADAVDSLRRALYVDPSFGLAAFQLGRAYDGLGDEAAARRFYAQALRALEPGDERHDLLLGQTDLSDIAAACSARLQALQ
jgi:chemotaxis protein methyltransferase CheR